MLISVCLCTYKRSNLNNTLDSISALNLPSDTKLEVLVVDNDEKQSGKLIVKTKEKGYPHKLVYLSEAEKNISIARNAYLKEAKGEWIASLDDDEIADKNWLCSLHQAAIKFNADIVFGKVRPIYPTNTPEWIVEGDFFNRKTPKTGTLVSSGGTSSVLIRTSMLHKTAYDFDLSFGLTGGEDSQLFYRLFLAGYKLIFCEEAFVSEFVEQNRLNQSYLLQRSFRIGQTYTRYRYLNGKSNYKTKLFAHTLKSLGKIFIFTFLTFITIPFGKKVYMKHYIRCVDSIGKITFLIGYKNIELYS